ncbi:MAG: hypothetical protein NTV31_08110 [Bacteroidia bacterium]|nr:hypothetical protein [Bacteroidia bacterium]
MKNIKLICKIFVLLVLSYSSPAYSINQDEKKDSFEISYKLNTDGKLAFKIYDSNLKVNVWKNSEVKLAGEIIVSGGDAADRDLLIKAFKSPEVQTGINSLDINPKFWKYTNSFMGLQTKTTLLNGEKVHVDKFKASYTLWIPESIAFALDSKYNNVEIADFAGVFIFDLYDVDIRTGNFGDNCSFDAKYSTLILGNGGNASFKIYDSKITAQNLKNVDIDSKYSTWGFSSVNAMKVGSYDDDFDIKNLTGIQGKATYSSLLLGGQMGNSSLDLYDTKVKGGSYESLTYTAKYSELIADKVGNLSVSSLYNCTVKISQVENFTCDESKYNDITLGIAGNSIKMPDTYDTKLTVIKVSQTFSSFDGNFKYGSVILNTDPALNYKLSFENTYGSINYPKERFSKMPLIYIEKNSKTQFEGSTDLNAICKISFTAYDLNFTIR